MLQRTLPKAKSSLRHYLPALATAACVFAILMPVITGVPSFFISAVFAGLAAYSGQTLWKKTGGIDHPVYIFLLLGLTHYGWLVTSLNTDETLWLRQQLLSLGAIFIGASFACALYSQNAQWKRPAAD